MPKQNAIKRFLNRKHKLMLLQADNLAQKSVLHFSNKKLLLFGLFFIIVFFGLSYLIIAFSPIKYTLPNQKDPQAEKKQQELIKQLNEMKIVISKQDSFIHSIQRMSGYLAIDSQKVAKKEEKISYLPQDYLKKVEKETLKEELPLAEIEKKKVSLQGKTIVLFPPINGILSQKFDIQDHYGIDVASKQNEPVKAVAEGYVVLSEYSTEHGFLTVIAHAENILSVYKHNSKNLKRVGSYVYSGEPIAIVGNSGENTTGPHLHFELWINGLPVNPLDYFTYIEK